MMNDNEIIRDFFMSRLERDGKSEALLDYTTGIRYYYQDFDVRSRKFANFLTDKAKIKKRRQSSDLRRKLCAAY